MNILLTLPYCTKDADLLKKMIGWMAELQTHYRPHSCLLVADTAVPYDTRKELHELCKPLFQHTETINVRVPDEKQNWPEGPNLLFASAARQIAEAYRLPWLWFEPDAVPLKAEWLDQIGLAYEWNAKRFMGSLVPSEGQADVPPVHLAGCAVYPPDCYEALRPFCEGKKPWDIASASYCVPRAAHFVPMQHYWGNHELLPTFKEVATVLDPNNVLTLDFLKSDSLTFHRSKDGSLIDLLRQKKNSRPMAPEPKKLRPRKTVPAQTVPADVNSEL